MGKELNNLIGQFKEAKGLKITDIHSNQFISEFYDWVYHYQLMGENYASFLDYMGLRFGDNDCAETDKGRYDSVVSSFDTLIISQSTDSKLNNYNRFIKGKMKVYNSTPKLIRTDGKNLQVETIPNDIIRTYMTQNPLNQDLISGWDDLHNSGNYNIILGIYGSIYDKNIREKIKFLESFKDKLITGDCLEDYTTIKDEFFYAVGSNRVERKRYRSR